MPDLSAALHVPAGGRGPGLKTASENAWLISAPASGSSRGRALSSVLVQELALYWKQGEFGIQFVEGAGIQQR